MAPILKCAICLFYPSSTDGDHFVITQCGHSFHFSCISKWIEEQQLHTDCPVCRKWLYPQKLVKLHGLPPLLQCAVDDNAKYNIKLTLLGDSGTGKSSLLASFNDNAFQPNIISTVGMDMSFKTLTFAAGRKVRLTLWDCAGQDRFRSSICPNYIRDSHGIILVYDVTKPETLENVEEWLKIVYTSAPPDVSISLVGNKLDLHQEREVTFEEGQQKAKSYGLQFIETSAKDSTNTEIAFRCLVAKILNSLWDDEFIDSFEAAPTPKIKLSSGSDNSTQSRSGSGSRCSC